MLPGDAAETEPGGTNAVPETLPPQPASETAAEDQVCEFRIDEPHIAAFAAWLDLELEQLELRWAPFAAPAALRVGRGASLGR